MPNAVELKTGFLLTRAVRTTTAFIVPERFAKEARWIHALKEGPRNPATVPLEADARFSLSFGVDCLGLKRQERHRRCTELSPPSGGFHGKTSELNIDSQRKVPIRRETENEAARDSPDSQRSHHDAGRL